MSAARLDFGDPEAVRRFFVDLRVTIDDAAGVTEDLLRPLRARDLGHREHRRLHREAAGKIRQLLDHADPPPPRGAPGAPPSIGNGPAR